MRRWLAGCLVLGMVIVAGCDGKEAGAPEPVPVDNKAPAAQGPAGPGSPAGSGNTGSRDARDPAGGAKGGGAAAPAAPAMTLVREEIPGGFRLGPFDSAGQVWWLGPDKVWFYAYAGEEMHYGVLSVKDGALEEGRDSEHTPFWDRWHFLVSPDGGRAVIYTGKVGPRLFVNRETGEVSHPEGPIFYGSNIFDSWSPDGSRFLMQSVRTDPVPGFYFLDRDGNPAGSFAEPGYYSHRGVWSPDGSRLAFLSVPVELFYPRSPEEWEEPPYGERVGVLNLETGQVTYFSLDGKTFYGHPVWSPDGTRLVAACGERITVRNSHPFEDYETTRLREPRPCLLDQESGAVVPMGDPLPGEVTISILGLADESVLVYWVRWPGSWGYGWIPMGGGPMVELQGKWSVEGAQFVAGGRAAVTGELLPNRLVLFNQQGEVERILAEGNIKGLTASPDGRHLAFFNNQFLTVLRVPEE